MHPLLGKRVLITGAGRGIGLEMAIQFAEAGAAVVLTDRDAEPLADAHEIVSVLGQATHAYQLDVTDNDAVVATRDRVLEEAGPVDIVVNNAGVVFGGAFVDVPVERHVATYRVNVEGVVTVLHAFLPSMLERPSAHIVNIASASAFVGLPYGATYASSKWAVLGLSESLRAEFQAQGHDHVGVTAICPSYIATGMFDGVQEPQGTQMLTPEFVAGRVVEAVLKRETVVLEPWLVKLTPKLKGLLPAPLFDRLGDALGVTRSMTTWQGHDGTKRALDRDKAAAEG